MSMELFSPVTLAPISNTTYATVTLGAVMITLYTLDNFRGQYVDINLYKQPCTNLPENITRKVSSLKATAGLCAALFVGKDCTGESVEVIGEYSPHLDSLSRWNFQNKISSVSLCRDECNLEGRGPSHSIYETLQVSIYQLRYFRGPNVTLDVKGCTLIPREFVGKLRSIETYGTCFALYDNPECRPKRPQSWRPASMQLRPYFPDFSDLNRWGQWIDHEARAISHCQYKCNRTALFVKPKEPDLNVSNSVTIFDWFNYTGNFLTMRVEKCTNIPPSWEGQFDSVRTHGSCLLFYTDYNCTGSSIRLNEDFPSLVQFNRHLQQQYNDHQSGQYVPAGTPIRSARLCNSSDEMEEDQPEPWIQSEDGNPTDSIFYLSVSLSLLLVLGIGSILTYAIIRRRLFRLKHQLSKKEIDEFLYGLQVTGTDHGESEHVEMNDDDGTQCDNNIELIQNIPFDKSKQVSLNGFSFDSKNLLGKGEFGMVYKGLLKQPVMDMWENGNDAKHKKNEEIIVAVKTPSGNANVEHLRSMLREAKVMMYVGNHSRLVEMLGCCTENLRHGQFYILLEYCENGSLEKFLQTNKNSYRNFVEKGRILSAQERVDNVSNPDYGMGPADEKELPIQFDYFQLIRWCTEIAEGMDYLAEKKVIHGDLATRNVLLDSNFHVKISDFGLSKRLYYYTQYIKKNEAPMPWRWLSVETLKNMEFTLKSDVWMFGVTCWEIFTLGDKPYTGVVWGKDFIHNLEDGLRLRMPAYSTSECYNLMLDCWDENPTRRPFFSRILLLLSELSVK